MKNIRKVISLVLVVTLIAMCGVSVSATECSHGDTYNTYSDYSEKSDCLVNVTHYIDTWCSDCGECINSSSYTEAYYDHSVEVVGESCDGMMHTTYYSCPCGSESYSESDWCSGGCAK